MPEKCRCPHQMAVCVGWGATDDEPIGARWHEEQHRLAPAVESTSGDLTMALLTPIPIVCRVCRDRCQTPVTGHR